MKKKFHSNKLYALHEKTYMLMHYIHWIKKIFADKIYTLDKKYIYMNTLNKKIYV